MKDKNVSVPMRTCLGCRQVKAQIDLKRLALVFEGEIARVVWDENRKMGGRGAWLCRYDDNCLASAVKRRSFNKAFRVQVFVEPPAERASLPQSG